MKNIQENLSLVEKYYDLYHTQEDRIRDMIFKGSLHSLLEIQDRVYYLYATTALKEVSNNLLYGSDRMLKNMFRAYIIHCESFNIVPTSGYSEEV